MSKVCEILAGKLYRPMLIFILKKSQINNVAGIGSSRNFQIAINDDHTLYMKSVSTITLFLLICPTNNIGKTKEKSPTLNWCGS